MLYQLAIYALSRPGAGAAVILYPTDTAAATDQEIEINDALVGSGRARVILRPVHLARLADLIEDGHSARRERASVAEQLVLGGPAPGGRRLAQPG